LHRTIQRQLSPKRPFAAVVAAVGPASGPLFTKLSLTGSNMRIADLKDLLMEGVAAFRRKRQQTTRSRH
jgi:hypothetical protein